MLPTKPDYFPPLGIEQPKLPKRFEVFVASPTDCDEAFRQVVRKVSTHLRHKYRDSLGFEDIQWRIGQNQLVTLSQDKDYQNQIEDQLGMSSDKQIVIGLFKHRKGSGATLKEIEEALSSNNKPRVFIFRYDIPPNMGEMDRQTHLKLMNQFYDLQDYLAELLTPLKTSPKVFNSEQQLETLLLSQLEPYLESWKEYLHFDAGMQTTKPTTIHQRETPLVFERNLEAYEPGDKLSFFGRTDEIKLCRKHIIEDGDRALKVVGASGVGKSSFVLAGLLPALQQNNQSWPCVFMRPMNHPFHSLAQAIVNNQSAAGDPLFLDEADQLSSGDLAHFEQLAINDGLLAMDRLMLSLKKRPDDSKLVLYIDQYEELLLRRSSVNKVAYEESVQFVQFLTKLLEHSKQIVIITSIRSDRDHLNSSAPWDVINELFCLNGRTFPISELKREIVYTTVKDSLAQGGFTAEEALLEALCDDLHQVGMEFQKKQSEQPSAFPLLSASLYELGVAWREKSKAGESGGDIKRHLTLSLYNDQVSGLSGVLAKRVKTVFDLHPELNDKALLNRLFFLLIRVDQNNKPVRKSQYYHGISDNEALSQLVKFLVDKRILRSEKTTFELIADVTFEAWPALRDWIAANQKDQFLFDVSELEFTADRWAAQSNTSAHLLIDHERLQQVESLLYDADMVRDGQKPESMTPLERYLHASRLHFVSSMMGKADYNLLMQWQKQKTMEFESPIHTVKPELCEKIYYALFPHKLLANSKSNGENRKTKTNHNPNPNLLRRAIREYFSHQDLKVPYPNNQSILHYAAMVGNIEILAHYEALGYNFFSNDARSAKSGALPLHMAIFYDEIELVRWFLQYPVRHEVFERKSDEEIRAIQKALVNTSRGDGWTCFLMAATRASLELVRLLLDAGADPYKTLTGYNALHLGVIHNNPEVVDFLLDKYPKLSQRINHQTILHLAAGKNSSLSMAAILQWLERNKQNRNNKNDEALDATDVPLIGQSLIDDQTNTQKSTWRNDGHSALFDIESQCDNGYSALHYAANADAVDCLQLLLENDADIDKLTKNSEKETALILAAAQQNHGCVSLLLEKGANIDLLDSHGWSALHYVCHKNGDSNQLIKQLIGPNTKPLGSNGTVEPPIFTAIRSGNVIALRTMLGSSNLAEPDESFQFALIELSMSVGQLPIAAEIFKYFELKNPWFIVRPDRLNDEQTIIERLNDEALQTNIRNGLSASVHQNVNRKPLLPGSWQALDKDAALVLLTQVCHEMPFELAMNFDAFGAVYRLPIPFYKNAILYEITVLRDAVCIGTIDVIHHNDTLAFLNGKSLIIHQLNQELPIQINSIRDAQDYVSFFCNSVHGEEGAFRVVTDTIELTDAHPLQHTIQRYACPIWPLFDAHEQQTLSFPVRFGATINYSNALFISTFSLSADGKVDMLDNLPIAVGLPLTIEIYAYGIRTLRRPNPSADETTGADELPAVEELPFEMSHLLGMAAKHLWHDPKGIRLAQQNLMAQIKTDLENSANTQPFDDLFEWQQPNLEDALLQMKKLNILLPQQSIVAIDTISALHLMKADFLAKGDIIRFTASFKDQPKGYYYCYQCGETALLLDGDTSTFDTLLSMEQPDLSSPTKVLQYLHFYLLNCNNNGNTFRMLAQITPAMDDANAKIDLPKANLCSDNSWQVTVVMQFLKAASVVEFTISERGEVCLSSEKRIKAEPPPEEPKNYLGLHYRSKRLLN